jgi:hypothetical protein
VRATLCPSTAQTLVVFFGRLAEASTASSSESSCHDTATAQAFAVFTAGWCAVAP